MARAPQSQAVQGAADPQLLALKVPPHSVEAEQSLIGGLLLDYHAFDPIGDLVSEAKTAELYTLIATDPVRVYVDVPQSVAASVRAGAEGAHQRSDESNATQVWSLPERRCTGQLHSCAPM